jgi:hypothetical protein
VTLVPLGQIKTKPDSDDREETTDKIPEYGEADDSLEQTQKEKEADEDMFCHLMPELCVEDEEVRVSDQD